VAVDGRGNVNVALNRPAYQVSNRVHWITGNVLYASYGNDGINNTTLGSCATTDKTTNPWWAVDLLAMVIVVGVNFTSRSSPAHSTYTSPRS